MGLELAQRIVATKNKKRRIIIEPSDNLSCVDIRVVDLHTKEEASRTILAGKNLITDLSSYIEHCNVELSNKLEAQMSECKTG